jgi:hypothetical protein
LVDVGNQFGDLARVFAQCCRAGQQCFDRCELRADDAVLGGHVVANRAKRVSHPLDLGDVLGRAAKQTLSAVDVRVHESWKRETTVAVDDAVGGSRLDVRRRADVGYLAVDPADRTVVNDSEITGRSGYPWIHRD